MLEAVITYLQAKLAIVFPEYDIKCLCDFYKDGNKTFVAEYTGSGQYKAIDLDKSKGTVYFRRNGDTRTEEVEEDELAGCDGMERHTTPVRVVLYGDRSALGDNATSETKLAENLRKTIRVNDDRDLRIALKADTVLVTPLQYSTDRSAIAEAELKGIEVKAGFEKVLIALDVEVEITGPPSCFEYWACDDTTTTFNEICPSVTVINSDGSFSQVVTAGDRLLLNDISATDGNGNIAQYPAAVDIAVPACLPGTAKSTDDSYALSVPSNGTATIPDSRVHNSDNSYDVELPATETLLLPDMILRSSDSGFTDTIPAAGYDQYIIPDITLTEADGTTTTHPYSETISAIQIPFVYSYPRRTEQTTSYATGDDAYIASLYFSNIPAGRNNQLSNFTTLVNNNSFGNKNRFTDFNGLQLWTDNYLIDNYTGLGWYITTQPSELWATAIANALAASKVVNGVTYDDWFMPSLSQQRSLFNYERLSDVLGWAPFSIAVNLNVSTTVTNNATNARVSPGGGVSGASKATTANYLLCRKHF